MSLPSSPSQLNDDASAFKSRVTSETQTARRMHLSVDEVTNTLYSRKHALRLQYASQYRQVCEVMGVEPMLNSTRYDTWIELHERQQREYGSPAYVAAVRRFHHAKTVKESDACLVCLLRFEAKFINDRIELSEL